MASSPAPIRLRGVRQNNLRNIDLDIPAGRLVVVTGLSGAGKSSLVFESLHAEGHRRYAETFSTYARQFLDLLDRPKLDAIDNIRPSIAIEQGNSVKTSRSTVGTMTELCDYFKVWFAAVAELFDPATSELITVDTPDTIWQKSLRDYAGMTTSVAFAIRRPGSLGWQDILQPLSAQGYTRAAIDGAMQRIDQLDPLTLAADATIHVIQDRIHLSTRNRARFKDAATTALHFGNGHLALLHNDGRLLREYCEGLHLPGSDRRFKPATPNLFSFNSPLGACPRCRGFGRIIELDERLVIPDQRATLAEGAIRAFSGAVYSESQRDLLRACKRHDIPTNVPWEQLSSTEQAFVMDGEADYHDGAHNRQWYGVRRFFKWLEENTYKMHVRVFLSRYRAYIECPDCHGLRLQPESLCWKWRQFSLPQLYRTPIRDLLPLMRDAAPDTSIPGDAVSLAHNAILTRLGYLEKVGLGYLSLDRSSRSLSGGETQRVHLTSCLGTSLVDTLFILDEPSVGLHARDIDRLIGILRELTAHGNTVVVVEHDEAVMRAADHLVEIGPAPGSGGGNVVYSGTPRGITKLRGSATADFLSGRRDNKRPRPPRCVDATTDHLRLTGIRKHNLDGLDVSIPLGRLVALSGVSGSGKSTLLNNAIYQGLLARSGKAGDDPAAIASIESDRGLGEIVMVDQSPASRTPRSNPAVFSGAWDAVRDLFATSDDARRGGYTASAFSFNSGNGRCPHCSGLGYERIEMQFMADVYTPCPICDGRQFRDEILQINCNGHNIAEVLGWTIDEALDRFAAQPKIVSRLRPLTTLGLGYLKLGQPLNTLSGGESQRLKLVRFAGNMARSSQPALILLDEPTTGLHRADVARLLAALDALVEAGHSVIVIEHHADVLRAADWIIELGPEAGDTGGQLVFSGTPEALATTTCATAPFIQTQAAAPAFATPRRLPRGRAAQRHLTVTGAREHNLKNISASVPLGQMTVVTGLSGSGKSTLAFDIIFAEGQRRFMESMSSWARQYVEQLPKPDVDAISAIPPTVAIEQRVTRGGRKSTVATITEVAQYLRLLYARIGQQHSPHTGQPLIAMPRASVVDHLRRWMRQLPKRAASGQWAVLAPLLRNRKGHHEPVAKWAANHGLQMLRIDGVWVAVDQFRKLDRYSEHTIEALTGSVSMQGSRIHAFGPSGEPCPLADIIASALDLGKDSFLVTKAGGNGDSAAWFSTRRCDPVTGEAFPDLDPKDFSWNAPRGWCPCCHGYGVLETWMRDDERFDALPDTFTDGCTCPECHGERLNRVSRHVFLHLNDNRRLSLPHMLKLTPPQLLDALARLHIDQRAQAILAEIQPEIEQRLAFMSEVGLAYLSMDRSATTLSGGEAQRIRLASQLGSNLTGALYVLDEPSIGLHERDNERLLQSLQRLKEKGNTLLVVEHDAATMRAADHVIDLGPAAGVHGGEVLTAGSFSAVCKHPQSLTARYLRDGIRHPLPGGHRQLPPPFNPRSPRSREQWIALLQPSLRNLKGDPLHLPCGRLIAVCGISGAGKSTLIRDLLMPSVRSAIQQDAAILKGTSADGFSRLYGANRFRSVVEVDQSPIGKTPRSTPATYIGIFDRIRGYFASLPDAMVRGLDKSTFSFNTTGGRCEACKGAGRIKLEMNFMPDAAIPCDECNGRRYAPELLDIQWNGKSIADVLDMTFAEAASFFHFDATLANACQLMVETGLGYLTLGQPSPTLSGGEAQRLKLVSELANGSPSDPQRNEPKLYILEEPTIGLHLHDVERLLQLLQRLVGLGHTVIVIEHHLDVIAEADFVVEIGPEGGDAGGSVLFSGSPQHLTLTHSSPTAPYLKQLFTI